MEKVLTGCQVSHPKLIVVVGGGDQPPSYHTTVRTVRYTAVSIVDVH